MSYHVLSSNVIFGEANVPGYSFVTTPGGVLQIERTDAMDALVDIGGNVECDHIALTSLTTPNRVLTTDVAGRIVQTTFDANGLGNASSFTSGTVPGGRLQGGSYTLGNLTANSVTAGSLVGNISANSITSGTLPAGRLNGSYTFADLTLSNALTASTLSANISANNITSGTVSDARMDGTYSFDALTLTGNLSASWVHGNISANNITTGTLHKDRLQGSYAFDTLTVSNVVTANAVNIPTLLGSNVLISNGNGYIVSSDVTQTELGFVSGVVSPIQTQINELAAGNIAGGNITNLDADNITFGILHDDRLVGNYSFANLELSDTLTANTITGSLDASYLTGTIPTGRISGSYTMANLTVAGAVVAGSVTGNMSANNLVSGTVPPARLAGESYSFESLQLTGNLTADSVNANVHASSIVGIIDNARLNLEGLVSNVTPATGDLTLGAEGAVWEKVYANTVHVDDIQLGNAILYKGNAVVLDLEQTTTNIVPAIGSTYSLGTAALPWREVHTGNVIAGGDMVVGGSLLNPDLTPYLDLSNVETNVLPISGGLAIGSVDRPWASLVATEATVDTLAISGNVTTDLVPSTGGLDLGTAGTPWGNVHAEEVHANIDVTNLYGELDANIVFTGGSIDGFVIKAPAGSAAQPGIRFVDDEDTGLFLAATGNVGISCGNAQALSITADQMTVAGNVAPAANAIYTLGSAGALWKDVHVSNAIYTGPVSITGGSIEGVANLAVSGQIDAGSVVAAGLVSGSTLEGNLDAAFLTGTVDPARISGDYEVTNLTVTGNANIAGTTTVAPSGHVVPQANLQYDLGSAEKVWRDIYLSGSTIHLGNATIQESGGNVTISKLYIDGSITADGLLSDMTISNVQIVDESWSVLDDTAVDTAGGKIIVNGSGFGPGSLCQIGGTNATSTSYMSPTQLRVETGARTTGTKSLTIVRGDTQTATLPAGVTFSDTVTWVTSSSLGNVEYAQGFTIPLVATSDSNVLYSNLTALPAQTTLDPETGVLSGNITSIGTSTLFSVDLEAVDEELQNATRTFLLQLIVLLLSGTAYTDASWNALTQTALDANTANVYWTIDGVGMNDATGVLVDDTPATSFTAVDDSTLRVTGPQKARGTYDVMVQSAVGTKVLANAVFFSDVPTWETDAQLGNVNEGVGFSIPILANSDSNVSYSNVTPLPLSTTLNSSTGLIEGNVTGIANDTTISFYVSATDAEMQSNTRTFTLTVMMVALGAFIGDSISYNISLVVTERGKLYSFGGAGYSGDGRGNKYIPTLNNNGSLTGKTISQISCSPRHTTVLATDGSVHAWGYNLLNEGSLGDGSGKTQRRPVAVNGGSLSGKTVSFVACGGYTEGKSRGYAIATDGSVHAWGYNGWYLGDGTATHRMLPVEITNNGSLNGRTLTKIVCGHQHTLAIDTDGYLHAWGFNSNYQLGDGSNTSRTLPILSTSGSLSGKTVADVACGDYWTHVLATDGSLHGFGNNSYGMIGDGTTTTVTVPKQINGGSLSGKTISHVSCGGRSSGTIYNNTVFALATDGTLHGWGYNAQYNLGDGATTQRTSPVALTGGSLSGKTISMVSTSNSYNGGTIAIATDGSMHAWGNNSPGKYGNGGTTTSTVPIAVSASGSMVGKVVSDIVIGELHVVALTTDGSLHVWGTDNYSTLGLSLGEDISANGSLNGKTISKAFGGYFHTLAIATDGTLHAWGLNNTDGQIGDGTQTTRTLPVAVTGGSLSGKTVTHVRAGYNYSVALASDSTLHTWGKNTSGQLGDGTTTARYSPVNITGTGSLSGKTVATISCGYEHTMVIATDGTLHGWGNNSSYKLGDGTQSNQLTPVFRGFSSCTGVACGQLHTVLITGGSLYICGNSEAQGDAGGTNTVFTYMMNGSLSGKQISAVAAGHSITLALATDSTLHSWGRNDNGQAGVGNVDYLITEPVEITNNGSLNGKTIVKISCGYAHSMALASDGTVHAWGYNQYNSLGDDSGGIQTLPVQVPYFGLQ